MKIFNLKLKNSYFLGEPFRVFRHCFFGCFHFFMFSFLKMCLGVFIVDCICSLHCVVVMRVLRMWDSIFYSHTFFFTLHSFQILSRLHWGCQFCLEGCRASQWGLKHGPTRSVCLSYTVSGNYVISGKLLLNLSKQVDKLLVAKSLVSLNILAKNIIIWWIVFKRGFTNVILVHVILLMLFWCMLFYHCIYMIISNT